MAQKLDIPVEIRKHFQNGNSSKSSCGDPLYIMKNELIKNVRNVIIGNKYKMRLVGSGRLNTNVLTI